MIDFVGTGNQITREQIVQDAIRISVAPAALLAVVDVEAAGEGFLSLTDHRMKMLFEAHLFSRFTGRRYDASHPDISARSWNRALYVGGAGEYGRIARAAALDETAALKSASWGLGQVLGMNHAMVGFETPQEMVETLKIGEEEQLQAVIEFCRKSGALARLQRNPPDFPGFTRIYNGTGQVDLYSGRLRSAYAKAQQGIVAPTPSPRTDPGGWQGVLVKGIRNDPRVGGVQRALQAKGYYDVPPLKIDDVFGPGTEWAVMEFQTSAGLTRDGAVGPLTATALGLS